MYRVEEVNNMAKYKITGYTRIGFEKVVECESLEMANQLADLIERATDVDDGDMNEWFDSVEVEEVEEINEE